MSELNLGSITIGTVGLDRVTTEVKKAVEQIEQLTKATKEAGEARQNLSKLNGVKLTSIEEQ